MNKNVPSKPLPPHQQDLKLLSQISVLSENPHSFIPRFLRVLKKWSQADAVAIRYNLPLKSPGSQPTVEIHPKSQSKIHAEFIEQVSGKVDRSFKTEFSMPAIRGKAPQNVIQFALRRQNRMVATLFLFGLPSQRLFERLKQCGPAISLAVERVLENLANGESSLPADASAVKMPGKKIDVTDLNEAQAEKLQKEQRWLKVISNIEEGITVADEQGNVIVWNRAMEKLTGIPAAEALSRKMWDMEYEVEKSIGKPKLGRKELKTLMTSIIKTGSAPFVGKAMERIVRSRTGMEYTVVGKVAAIPTDKGHLLVGTALDVTDLKRAQDVLVSSEKRYRQLFELAQEGIWVIDENAVTTLVNPSMAKMLGYKTEEMGGRPLWDFMDEEQKTVAAYYFGRRKSGIAEVHEFIFRSKQNRPVVATLATAPLIDDRGNFCGAIAGVVDITEQKKAEQELIEARNSYQTLFEGAPEPIYLHIKNRIIDANKSFVDLLGYDNKDQVIGKSIFEILHPKYHEIVKERLRNIKAKKAVAPLLEEQFIRKDGTAVDVEVSASEIIYNNRKTIQVLIRNISERKKAEEALRKNERQLRTIFDTVDDVILLLAPVRWGQYQCISINDNARKKYGINTSEIAGKKPAEFLPPSLAAKLQEKLDKVVRNKRRISWQDSGRFARGEFHVMIAASPVLDEQGQCSQIVVSLTDISEIISAQQKLKTSRDELRLLAAHLQSVREEERRAIAREIHDEFAQVLTAIKINLAIMLGDMEQKNQQAYSAYSKDIKASMDIVDRAIVSIRKLVANLRPDTLDKLGLTNALHWQAKDVEAATGIPCRFSGPENLISLGEDKDIAVYRIVQESITNAVRYAEANQIDITMELINGLVQVTIEDDGKGFDPKKVEAGGSFGLLGMKERALVLGGHIDIKSTPGKGTCITLQVPATNNH